MHFVVFILGIIALTIIAPIWIFAHYLVRWRATRAMSRDAQRALGELWEVAKRLEALEKVLDAQAPGWRPSR
jgi:phage shock protein B